MDTTAPPTFLALHVLRLKGFASDDAIATLCGVDVDRARRCLADAAEAGLARRRDGALSGWSLTPEGRQRHAELVAEELEVAGARAAVADAYGRFKALNDELLEVCTAWQLRDGALNDHGDPGYDAGVIARLGTVDAAVQPVCADLGAALDRFSTYGSRLARALERVRAGDREWFAKPMIDSYHTVWFELHEDLLVTLGLERAKEAS